MEVGDGLLSVLAADVGRDVVHRPRAIEGDHRGEVVDRRRAKLADVAAHARGLELEDAGRLARREQLEGLRVVERDRVEIDGDAAMVLHEVDRLAEDRQVREPQEVELEQPQGLDRVHLVLGHQRIRVGRLLERHELGQGLAADDHARGVRAGISGDALEMPREVRDPLDRRGPRRPARAAPGPCGSPPRA